MKIIFIGDSISAGARGEAVGFPIYVQKYLKEKFKNIEFNFETIAFWGYQTSDMINYIKENNISLKADIVVLEMGTNDVLHNYDNNSLSNKQFKKRYLELVNIIKENNPILLIVEPYILINDPMRSYKRDLLVKFNKSIKSIAKDSANEIVLTDTIFKQISKQRDASIYMADYLHLNDAGAKLVGRYCLDKIEKILETYNG